MFISGGTTAGIGVRLVADGLLQRRSRERCKTQIQPRPRQEPAPIPPLCQPHKDARQIVPIGQIGLIAPIEILRQIWMATSIRKWPTGWSESITREQFRKCARKAGVGASGWAE